MEEAVSRLPIRLQILDRVIQRRLVPNAEILCRPILTSHSRQFAHPPQRDFPLAIQLQRQRFPRAPLALLRRRAEHLREFVRDGDAQAHAAQFNARDNARQRATTREVSSANQCPARAEERNHPQFRILVPLPRMRDMTSERLAGVKTSVVITFLHSDLLARALQYLENRPLLLQSERAFVLKLRPGELRVICQGVAPAAIWPVHVELRRQFSHRTRIGNESLSHHLPSSRHRLFIRACRDEGEPRPLRFPVRESSESCR